MKLVSSRHGFTLIELLTVIAIVAILVGILIPTLRVVRASAVRSECASNIRQVAIAVINYEAENRRLPGPVQAGISHPSRDLDDQNNLAWHLSDFLGNDGGVWDNTASAEAREANARQFVYLLNNKPDTNPPFIFGTPGDAFFTAAPPISRDDIVAAGQTEPESNIRSLSRIWMVSNIDSLNYGSDSPHPIISPLPPTVLPPHGGGRNYAYFDGHVEFHRPNNWPANP